MRPRGGRRWSGSGSCRRLRPRLRLCSSSGAFIRPVVRGRASRAAAARCAFRGQSQQVPVSVERAYVWLIAVGRDQYPALAFLRSQVALEGHARLGEPCQISGPHSELGESPRPGRPRGLKGSPGTVPLGPRGRRATAIRCWRSGTWSTEPQSRGGGSGAVSR